MSSFISIVNWERHQHYKDRNPPWIKLHRDLLTSETWVSSDDASKALAIALMMLAAEHGNRIPANPRFIQRRAYLEKEPDLSGLIALNFIEIIEENDVASKPLADRKQVAPTETENREESPVAIATGDDARASQKGTRIPKHWLPEKPYPPDVKEMRAAWPPGREARELNQFRDYWLTRSKDAAKLDWDRTWWNRIRDVHDKVMRTVSDGRRNGRDGEHPYGRTVAAAEELIAEYRAARPVVDGDPRTDRGLSN